MTQAGLRLKLARMTRKWREQFETPPTSRPVGRFSGPAAGRLPQGSIEGRLGTVEVELARLANGWDQHLPQLLDAVSVAQTEYRSAEQVHARIDALRRDVDRLSERLDLNLSEIRDLVESLRPLSPPPEPA